jgi:hypothetical protein
MGSASELGFGSQYLHECDPDERALGFGIAKFRSALGVLLTYTHRRSRTVRELVRCGKPSCGCATDVRRRHGQYWYLRFEEFDRRTGQTHYRREYVPQRELARVRRWIRCSRAASACARAVLSFLRHYVTGMEARARRRPGCGPLSARSDSRRAPTIRARR